MSSSSKPADSGDGSAQALQRHRSQCRICRHAERDQIEREFLDWTSPRELAETYRLGSYRSVYRHAHALGLFEKRRSNFQFALDRIIEHAAEVKVTASAVIAAVRLSVHLQQQQEQSAARQHSKPAFFLSLNGLPRTDAVCARPPQNPAPSCDGNPPAPKPVQEPPPVAQPHPRPALRQTAPAPPPTRPWPDEQITFARGRRLRPPPAW